MKFVILSFLLMASSVVALSQEKPKAIKIGQFNDRVEPMSALKETFEMLVERLLREPSTTRGYVALAGKYPTLQKVNDAVHKTLDRNAALKSRIILDGDRCPFGNKPLMTEFWILPTGAAAPYESAISCDIFCSPLTVTGQSPRTNRKENLVFTAAMSGPVTYKWSIQGGKIVAGQNTPVITVKAKSRVKEVTATVKIGGLPEGGNCKDTDSATTQIQSK